MNKRKFVYRLISIFIGVSILYSFGFGTIAQEDPPAEEAAAVETVELTAADAFAKAEEVQNNLDHVWILLAGFLVFFMQAGFAMLEGGMIRETGVVNSLAENFMDACVTAIVFFIVGYGIAFGSADSSGFFPQIELFLGGATGAGEGDGSLFVNFFFQFAFAGAAATIATGAMAERTEFVGKLIYSAILGAIIYPVVVFWTWGEGWLYQQGFLDFAGSTIVHMTGGIVALMGAWILGPRAGRVFGRPPAASNLALASLGTFILWVGWYGFNVGSTLGAGRCQSTGVGRREYHLGSHGWRAGSDVPHLFHHQELECQLHTQRRACGLGRHNGWLRLRYAGQRDHHWRFVRHSPGHSHRRSRIAEDR